MAHTTEPTNPPTSPVGGPPTVIVGGNGKTGRRVADRLRRLGTPVRAVSRSTTPSFDWYDPGTWGRAFDGARAAYLTFQPDLAVPGSVDIVSAAATAAREHGVTRLVLLSGRGEPAAQECEQVVLDAGVEATVVRCSFFAQNFSEHFLVQAVLDGVIALPAGAVREPIVDADDIADVATLALTEPGHAGRIYELTGPELLTFGDVADRLGEATGRDIAYVPVSADDYAAGAIAEGVPPEEAEMLAELFGLIFDGHNESLADGVQQALGRPAGDFATFARRAAAAGAWGPIPVGADR